MPEQRHAKKKKNRNISKDPHKTERAVLAAFRHDGRPTFQSLRHVAAEMGITVQAVYSLLAQAHEQGLFHVLVDLPHERQEIPRLEEGVRARFGLKKVVLVPGEPEILRRDLDQMRRRELHTVVTHKMAIRVGDLLDALVVAARPRGDATSPGRAAEGLVTGVAWGRTLAAIASHLGHTQRPRAPYLTVVPVVGITAVRNTHPVEGNVIAMNIAQAYGGVAEQLPSPAFVPSMDYDVVTRREPIHAVLQRLRTSCRVVITGMGPIPADSTDGSEIRLSNDERQNRAMYEAARSKGAIAEVFYCCVARDGTEVRPQYRPVGLGFKDLQEMAGAADRQVVLVTGGDRRRFEALEAVLKARLASTLISDSVTARYLTGELVE